MTDTGRKIPGLSHTFKNPELLVEALTHRSRGSRNYERMEFLGDSVLSFVVASRLFQTRPEVNEGDLSRMRSRVVRGETLAEVARELGLGDHLIMGDGELKSGGFRRDSILGDVLESLLGAIYLDGGFTAVEKVILEVFDPIIKGLPDVDELKDPKTRLQEWLQASGRPLPEYDLVREEGADHAKKFHVLCRLPDTGAETAASGSSRRRAEQASAALTLQQIEE